MILTLCLFLKKDTIEVQDYMLISLINSMQKYFSKLLANRLQDKMQYLVLLAQTGFMRKKHINEGFIYAQEVVTMATKHNEQISLFKTNIFKAFDTIP
jgi:hypothetical protein